MTSMAFDIKIVPNLFRVSLDRARGELVWQSNQESRQRLTNLQARFVAERLFPE